VGAEASGGCGDGEDGVAEGDCQEPERRDKKAGDEGREPEAQVTDDVE
jgi:hypothetical protein